jgi:hypothetical protein
VMASHGKRRETGAKGRRDKNAKKPPCLLDHRPRLILRFVSEGDLMEGTSHGGFRFPLPDGVVVVRHGCVFSFFSFFRRQLVISTTAAVSNAFEIRTDARILEWS